MFKKTTTVLVFLFIQVLYVSTAYAEDKTIATNLTISQDATWDKTIILDGAKITIEQNAVLTISPGTIVAGRNGASIYVKGKLRALGEKDKRVRFTSEGNGKPNFSIAYSIDSTDTSEIEMKNFILEYGGGNIDTASLPAFTVRGKGNFSNGIIRRNHITAVRVWSKDVRIEDCEIYENESIGIENKSTANTLKAENNWWGASDGPVQYAINSGSRDRMKGDIDYDPWREKGPIPIVILPGFGGSFSFRLLSDKAKDDWWLTPVGTAAYRYFVKSLILNNYFHDKDFFWGFYDWRMPCRESAENYLKNVIDEAKSKSGHSQVHIVAHSLGGLVARDYIQSESFRDDVDRLVTAGTPHLGASEIYPIWEGGKLLGDKEPINVYLWYLEIMKGDWNNLDFIRKNFPSLGQMMPIYDFLEKSGSGKLICYKDQKGRNQFLENLSYGGKNLRRITAPYLIAGTGKDTLDKIQVDSYNGGDTKWTDGVPDPLDPPKDTKKGDGTVTVKSATAEGKITEETHIIESGHKELLRVGAESIFEQLKVKAKFPLLTKIMQHFLLTVEGLVDVQIKNAKDQMLDSIKHEIKDGQFFEQMIGKNKLLFAAFPADASADEDLIKITFIGQEAGKFRAAFWNLSPNDDFSKRELEKSIDKGIEVSYEIKMGEKENGDPEITVEKVAWSNLLRVEIPEAGKKYLNWRKIVPRVNVWQDAEDLENISDINFNYELDGNPVGRDIDPGEISLGSHNLKITGRWKIGDQEQSEEKEVPFEVSTSLKSLMALINRFHRERKIVNWETRSSLINLLAEAYQESSNGRASGAKAKILAAKDLLKICDESVFANGEESERLAESLNYLANISQP